VGATGVASLTGAAYAFTTSAGGSWANQNVAYFATGGAMNDKFGSGVALSDDGTKALVGAQGVSTSTGAAYSFSNGC